MAKKRDIRHNNKPTLILHGEVNNKVLVGVKGTKPQVINVDGYAETINVAAIVGKEVANSRDEPITPRCWFALDLETGRGGTDEHPSWYPGCVKYAKITWAELKPSPSATSYTLKEINNETLAIEGIEANNLVWYKLTSDSMTGYVSELQISQFVYRDN